MLQIPSLKNRKTVFLAVGNIMRADDAFGPLVYEALAPRQSQNFLPLNGGQMPENFSSKIRAFAPDYLIIADAAAWAAPSALPDADAATLQITDESDIINPALSTHALPLDIMLKFLKQDLPRLQIILITAAAEYTGFERRPSQKIIAAAKQTAAAIIEKL